MSNRLINTTFTGKDISAGAVIIYTYTATKAATVRFRIGLNAVAGGGDYIFWMTLQRAGAGATFTVLPKTTGTAGASETALMAMTMPIDVVATDVINVYVDGLAGDTDEAGTVEVFEDDYLRPTTAAQYNTDVTATGAVGIDWANVEGPTATVGLSGTTVKAVTDTVGANLLQILGTALTETVAGYLAAAFKKLFNVVTPVFTAASVNQTGDSYPSVGDILTDTGTTLPATLATLATTAALTTVDGIVDDILVDTGTTLPASIAALPTADTIHDEVVEGTLTFRQITRIILAALAGKTTGGGTTAPNYRDNADTKNRIAGTVDSSGNRTAVTLDGS